MKSGKYFLTLLLMGLTLAVWGQSAEAAPAAAPAVDQLSRIMTYILVSAGALLFIIAMIYVIKVNQYLYRRVLTLQARESGVVLPEAAATTAVPAGENFWSQLRKKYWEDAVPIEREEEIISHHDFDGIRELDNSLPPWWVNMFILTVIWAVIYMFYYHWGGNGPSQVEEYQEEMAAAKREMLLVSTTSSAGAVDENTVTQLTESSAIGEGELTYKNLCAACHGQNGEGGIGPNMTDEYWIHGGGVKNIFRTIKYGVPEKGMVPWASQIKPVDMQKLTSYILTLQGTNPENAKEPQGVIWKEEEEATTAPDGAVQDSGSGTN